MPTHVRTYARTHIHTHALMHTQGGIQAFLIIYTHTHIYTCTHTCTHARTHTLNTHTHIHTCTHALMQARVGGDTSFSLGSMHNFGLFCFDPLAAMARERPKLYKQLSELSLRFYPSMAQISHQYHEACITVILPKRL